MSARLETAAWYMASQLVGGTASESTESIWVLGFKVPPGSPALVESYTAGSDGKQKARRETIVKKKICVLEKKIH